MLHTYIHTYSIIHANDDILFSGCCRAKIVSDDIRREASWSVTWHVTCTCIVHVHTYMLHVHVCALHVYVHISACVCVCVFSESTLLLLNGKVIHKRSVCV